MIINKAIDIKANLYNTKTEVEILSFRKDLDEFNFKNFVKSYFYKTHPNYIFTDYNT